MITLKSKREQEMMHKAGQLLAACHKEIAKRIQPGVTTDEIDRFVENYLREHGATPEQKGYNGYQYATCASLNDEICHGFPRKTSLKEGDLITIDSVFNLNGALADSAWTYAVGHPSPEAEALMAVTHQALYEGIKQAKIGNRLGDIGHAIQSFVEPKGYSVVRDFTGHGIGPTLHEPPQILHYGSPGKGIRLKEGMVITIEPMVNTGAYHSKLDSNGWTARTVDGSLSAQYEHTLVITADGPFILTDQGDAASYL